MLFSRHLWTTYPHKVLIFLGYMKNKLKTRERGDLHIRDLEEKLVEQAVPHSKELLTKIKLKFKTSSL